MSSRGVRTQSKLLDVATKLFSARGFAAVSTRELASGAGTTLPSIAHHFGSKEGLYKAVHLEIARQMEERLAPSSLAAIAVLAKTSTNREEKLVALHSLLGAYAKALLESRSEWTNLVAQEEFAPTGALTPVNEVLKKNLFFPLMQLVASIRGLPTSSPDVKLQTFCLLGMVMVFRTIRSAVLQALDWPKYTPERIDIILASLDRDIRLLFKEA